MTVQPAKYTWQRDHLATYGGFPTDSEMLAFAKEFDDPTGNEFPAMVSATVVAKPAPGYAILFGSNHGTAGFLEFSFTEEGFTNAKWTRVLWAGDYFNLAVGDYAPIGGSNRAFYFFLTCQVFPAESAIAVVGSYASNASPEYFIGGISRRVTYGTTFGSLNIASGVGLISGTQDQTGAMSIIALSSTNLLWIANRWLDSFQPAGTNMIFRGVSDVGATSVGTSVDADNPANYHRIEASHIHPDYGLTDWSGVNTFVHYGTPSQVMAFSIISEGGLPSLWYSTTINSSGNVGSWQFRRVSNNQSVHAGDPGLEWVEGQRGSRQFAAAVDQITPTEVSGSWTIQRPPLEVAGGNEIHGGIESSMSFAGWVQRISNYFQVVGSGLVEAYESPMSSPGAAGVTREWNMDTGENIDAWNLPTWAYLRRAQLNPPVWIGTPHNNGNGHFYLYTEAPPEPTFTPGPPIDDGSCLELVTAEIRTPSTCTIYQGHLPSQHELSSVGPDGRLWGKYAPSFSATPATLVEFGLPATTGGNFTVLSAVQPSYGPTSGVNTFYSMGRVVARADGSLVYSTSLSTNQKSVSPFLYDTYRRLFRVNDGVHTMISEHVEINETPNGSGFNMTWQVTLGLHQPDGRVWVLQRWERGSLPSAPHEDRWEAHLLNPASGALELQFSHTYTQSGSGDSGINAYAVQFAAPTPDGSLWYSALNATSTTFQLRRFHPSTGDQVVKSQPYPYVDALDGWGYLGNIMVGVGPPDMGSGVLIGFRGDHNNQGRKNYVHHVSNDGTLTEMSCFFWSSVDGVQSPSGGSGFVRYDLSGTAIYLWYGDIVDDEYVVYPDDDGLWAMGDDGRLTTFVWDFANDYNTLSFITVGWPDIDTRYVTGGDWANAWPTYPLTIAVRPDDTVYWINQDGPIAIHEGRDPISPVVITLPWDVYNPSGVYMTPSLVWNEPDQALYLYGYIYDNSVFKYVGWRLIRVDPTDWSWAVVGTYDSDDVDISNDEAQPVVTPDGAVWVANIYTPYTPDNPGTWDDGGWPGYIRYVPGGPSAEVTAFQYDPYWGNDYWPYTEGNNNYVFIPRPNNSVWFLSEWDGDGWQLDPDGTVHHVPLLDRFSYNTDFIAASPSAQTVAMWAWSSPYELWNIHKCGGGPRFAVSAATGRN